MRTGLLVTNAGGAKFFRPCATKEAAEAMFLAESKVGLYGTPAKAEFVADDGVKYDAAETIYTAPEGK